jgi:opacity protein-like surface antigen
MKKIVFVALALMLALAVPAFAVEGVKVAVGADSDFIVNREVVVKDVPGVNADISAQRVGVKSDVTLGDMLTVTPKVGLTTVQAETDISGTNVDINSALGWTVGVDAKADLLKTQYGNLAGIGSYRYSRVDEGSVKIGTNKVDAVLNMHEYEVGGEVYRNLQDIVNLPITGSVGVVYSDLVGDLGGAGVGTDIEANDNVGLRLGLAMEPIKSWEAKVNVKLVDQTAIGGQVTYRF